MIRHRISGSFLYRAVTRRSNDFLPERSSVDRRYFWNHRSPAGADVPRRHPPDRSHRRTELPAGALVGREGPVFLVLHHRHHQFRRAVRDRAAADAALDHHRRHRPASRKSAAKAWSASSRCSRPAKRSRGALRPRFASSFALFEIEGAGKTGCLLHPRSRVRFAQTKVHTSIQGSGSIPAFPAQWLYGLLRALPGERLFCLRRQREKLRFSRT
jgi:hypothetical protein